MEELPLDICQFSTATQLCLEGNALTGLPPGAAAAAARAARAR